ncbi:hypothetical protein [Spirochaeta africana]|uniref:Uncharacterized protein n=1 Tax=Spirochaeta africana (strain ATCC 700263 / DSM 8902 / Z-7692) TaxID=889378 RepID=H9UJE1_SPIAZ|nr:hypothetical protein [Spirochaeta africana]AFG37634.1 hypothetical protein Spiaf_1575 [Spirochaeta africana DSM 8902]
MAQQTKKKTPVRQPQQVERATAAPTETPEKPSRKKIEIELLKVWASPDGIRRPGDTVEVSETVADKLERAGAGRRV